jgi:hypothetical protein
MAKNKEKQPINAQDDLAAHILLKEADESLRQEKITAFWEEWGSTIIGVALMVIFGTMVGVGWNSWRASVHASQTTDLIALQEKGFATVLLEQDDLTGSYEGMAKMMAAAEIANTPEAPTEQTAAMVHNLLVDVEDSDMPKNYDILARWGILRTKTTADDKADPILVAEDMVDLAHERDNPYAPLILSEAAILYGENSQQGEAIGLLEEAKTMPLTQNAPKLLKYLDDLLQLYSLENTSNKDKS